MTKIKEILLKYILVKNENGGYVYISNGDIDTAASAIEKVHDEEMVGFAEWLGNYDWVPLVDKNKELTTAQLLQLYKNK